MPRLSPDGRSLAVVLFAGVCLARPLPAPAQGKVPLDYKSYAEWRSLLAPQLSADGKWVVYSLTSRSGDAELIAREVDSSKEIRIPRGRTPDLSPDGRYALYTLPPSAADLEKARQENRRLEEMPRTYLGILDLGSGKTESVERVRGFRLPELDGTAVAYQLEAANAPVPTGAGTAPGGTAAPSGTPTGGPPTGGPGAGGPGAGGGRTGGGRGPGAAAPGTGTPGAGAPLVTRATPAELVVRDLPTGKTTSLGLANDYSWTRDGSWLAFTGAGGATVVKVRSTGTGEAKPVFSGTGRVQSLTWSRDGKHLTFLSNAGEGTPEKSYSVYVWDAGQEKARRVASGDSALIPNGVALNEASFPRFSRDGERLFLSLTGSSRAPQAAAGTPGAAAGAEPLKVDIWNYKDGQIQPMQKVRAPLDGRRSYAAVVQLGMDKMTVLGGPDAPSVDLPDQGEFALGMTDEPYRMLVSWDTGYSDLSLIRLKDGRRTRLLTKHAGGASLSPTGKYAMYFDRMQGAWHAITVDTQADRNLTGGTALRAANELWDQPSPAPPYGIAGWTANDASVLFYDRYDVWEVPMSDTGAKPRCLTGGEGRKKKITFRYQRTDPEETTVPTDKPLLLSAFYENTGDTGFSRSATLQSLATARGGKGAAPEVITVASKRFGPLTKAKRADRYLFTLQRFDQYPDLYVAGGDLKEPRRISDANPQQARYRWGKAELIKYRSKDGLDLQGILIRPDDAPKDQKLPLLINMYERMSDRLHNYVVPAAGTSPSVIRYVSHGYAVLLPDLAYKIGKPGESAYNCLIPAVDKAISLGGIDPQRVAITGHSWGGYEVSYLVARTDRFRAAVAGAPVVNMTSAYGGVRWQTGMSRAFQYERTQSRIGAPPWVAQEQFIQNSPLFKIDRVKTPTLILHNDADGAVPWYQGIEFFSALRRLGKEAYLFNYNDQGHGLTDQAAMRHWTVHMDEFMDHHMLGKPLPEWMDKGVPYVERGKRDITALFGSPPRPSATPTTPAVEGGE